MSSTILIVMFSPFSTSAEPKKAVELTSSDLRKNEIKKKLQNQLLNNTSHVIRRGRTQNKAL